MEKRVKRLGYDFSFNPPGDGDFFYVSAAKAFGIETQGLKNVIFDFLKSHQLDVSIELIANSPTTNISLLCQLAAIFTAIFGQNSQQLEMLILQLQHCERTCNFQLLAYLEMKPQMKYCTGDSI